MRGKPIRSLLRSNRRRRRSPRSSHRRSEKKFATRKLPRSRALRFCLHSNPTSCLCLAKSGDIPALITGVERAASLPRQRCSRLGFTQVLRNRHETDANRRDQLKNERGSERSSPTVSTAAKSSSKLRLSNQLRWNDLQLTLAVLALGAIYCFLPGQFFCHYAEFSANGGFDISIAATMGSSESLRRVG